MNLYALSLAIGAVGFLAMALSGLGRHGHAHARGPAHGHAHGGVRHGRAPGHGQAHGSARANVSSWLWSLTSPRVLFSLLIGFGATGMVVRTALGRSVTLAAAVAGGMLLEQLAVGWCRFWRRCDPKAAPPACGCARATGCGSRKSMIVAIGVSFLL